MSEELATEWQEGTDVPQSEIGKPEPALKGVSLCDITCDVHNDPNELLKRRFLCRAGGAMLIGPTGIGKSSFLMQAAVLWSLGKSFFGIEPARPLTSLIIQAENDDGDLVEMREGMFTGLGLSEEEKNLVRERVIIYSENAKSGETFVNGVLRPLLREHRPDLLWLDNLFAYCGCGVSEQDQMTQFLRTQINPLIQDYRCGIIIAHHTNKPPIGVQKAEWSVSETAYLGSGTGELANWPRAILSIRDLKTTEGVFELVAGKRGGRLRWKDAEGKMTCRRNIAHSTDGLIYWRDAQAEEIETQKAKPSKYDVQKLLFVGQEMAKEALISKANSDPKLKLGLNKTKGFISELVGEGIFKVIKYPRSGTNPAIFLERVL
jgi:hypothetical protein